MKYSGFKQSLMLFFFGLLALFLAYLIPRLVTNYWLSIAILIPVVSVGLGGIIAGGYELFKAGNKSKRNRLHK